MPCADGVAVLQEVNLRGRRRHAFLQDGLSGQGVDEGALAGVEFADDHEQEEFVELADGRGERRLVLLARAEARQRIAQLGEQLAPTVQLA